MKKRFISAITTYSICFAIGFIYLVFSMKTGMAIPCVFYEVTGLLCPSCGLTRMIWAMARLDFATAYGYNKILFITLPLIIAIIAWQEICYVRTGNRTLGKFRYVLAAEGILLILFGVVRNIV